MGFPIWVHTWRRPSGEVFEEPSIFPPEKEYRPNLTLLASRLRGDETGPVVNPYTVGEVIPASPASPASPAAPGGTQMADVIGPRTLRLTGNGGQIRETRSYLQFGEWFAAGWRPIRADGTQMRVDMFMGGELFDGHPLNVLQGLGWIEGQQSALADAVLSGQIPTPTIDLSKVYRPGAGSGGGTLTLLAAGVVALVFVGKRRVNAK